MGISNAKERKKIKLRLTLKSQSRSLSPNYSGGGRVVRRCWVNFQCQGVLLTWLTVGQGPIVLSVGAGGGCLDIFSLIYHFSFLSPSLWEMARYRLKYCLKGPLSPKQPTNQPTQTTDISSKFSANRKFTLRYQQFEIKGVKMNIKLEISLNYVLDILEKVSIGHGCPRQMPFRKRVYM